LAAAAEHLCRQALHIVLRLSLSGHFLLRFGVTLAANAAALLLMLLLLTLLLLMLLQMLLLVD
jgi:hypothetical protein